MEVFSKPRKLFVVQSDNINGEEAGAALEEFYRAGAKNVQLINAVTKKNRPSYMFVVDGDNESTSEIQEVILHGVRATGWHEISSDHCFVRLGIVEKEVLIEAGDDQFIERITRKVSSSEPELIRPEYECCKRIRERLNNEYGLNPSFALVKQKLEQAFACSESIPTIRF